MGLQEAVDAQQNHDKYLYDMRDFSGQATPNTDPEMINIVKPPVPPDPGNPDKPTIDHLTIDARVKGARLFTKSSASKLCSSCLAYELSAVGCALAPHIRRTPLRRPAGTTVQKSMCLGWTGELVCL